ncbi:unnamed protein product [Eruca vesicaria subsp. sativa]|uniref:Uncharacterized protein n=1 Tax=Eruca vesicaria subsp. sativa TaxID=29727 RepID=A0ABC8M1V6_ERUVS|nr:unnamed protein product [Eruca vesicaria subsp. sativa]
MRRGRGKGKKQSTSAREDHGSGQEDEKIPAYRRRGRPHKPMKDDFEEEEEEELIEKIEEEEEDGSVTSKKEENERKRKMVNGSNTDVNEEGNGLGLKSSRDGSTTSTGFRQNGSRRKSKPRRAAEAVVECNGV